PARATARGLSRCAPPFHSGGNSAWSRDRAAPLRLAGGPRARDRGSCQLLIVTAIPAEVVEWPEVSRATAVSVYAPFGMVVESHVSVYFVSGDGVVTAAPMFWPLSANWTPPTAQSSA